MIVRPSILDVQGWRTHKTDSPGIAWSHLLFWRKKILKFYYFAKKNPRTLDIDNAFFVLLYR